MQTLATYFKRAFITVFVVITIQIHVGWVGVLYGKRIPSKFFFLQHSNERQALLSAFFAVILILTGMFYTSSDS